MAQNWNTEVQLCRAPKEGGDDRRKQREAKGGREGAK